MVLGRRRKVMLFAFIVVAFVGVIYQCLPRRIDRVDAKLALADRVDDQKPSVIEPYVVRKKRVYPTWLTRPTPFLPNNFATRNEHDIFGIQMKKTNHKQQDPKLLLQSLEPPRIHKRIATQYINGRKVEIVHENYANAVIVILARNSELPTLIKTMANFEKRFNSKYNYPYVFLNEETFSDDFKAALKPLTNSTMDFGLIPSEHWSYPKHIDKTLADQSRTEMNKKGIIYGGSLSYRFMCRYNSGYFFRHPLLQDYEYYWRVEPHVEFLCDIDYDPFLYMKRNSKKYGFVITLPEFAETIPTLWNTTVSFMRQHPQYVANNNSLGLMRETNGTYNMCHFWSNFEIASLDFLRSPAYTSYFEYLEEAGGFFYERWGDAPVHSLAVGMFLSMKEIHYFQDFGYVHAPNSHCPWNPALLLKCDCDPTKQNVYPKKCHQIFLQKQAAIIDN